MRRKKSIPIARPFISGREIRNIQKVFETHWLGMGSFVYEFEERIRNYIGVRYAVAVNTGTTAIHLALSSLGIGHGDEVIVPSLTFVGSVQPIISLGARPVFCEIEKETLNIDIEDAGKRITRRTKAVIPVHYGGMPCNMDALLKLAEKHSIYIVEDAAHAFGANYNGRKIGSFGHITCFSFDPIKNITCGEGGAVVTNNSRIAKVLRLKRLLGINKDTWVRYKNRRSWFYEVITEGYRYHMSNINAAIGLAQFERLERFIEKKIEIVKDYDRFFGDIEDVEILNRKYEGLAPFNYTIKIKKNRNRFIQYMKKNGISVGINYIPNHLQPFFKRYKTRLPVTEKVWKEIATLPLFYDMTKDDIDRVKTLTARFIYSPKHT